MEKTKKKTEVKGITLIALVITIIVILILAAISISMLTGDNGVLTRAGEVKEKTRVAEDKEQVELAAISAMTDGKGTIKDTTLRSDLKNNLKTLKDEDITGNETSGWQVAVNGKVYFISNTGSVEEVKWIQNADGTIQNVKGTVTGLKIGDTINYDPKAGLDTTDANVMTITSKQEDNGYGDQTIDLRDYTKTWRLFDIKNGKLEIISSDCVGVPSESDSLFYLRGRDGYKNAETELNIISSLYGKGTYATGARSVTIEDVNKITGYNPNAEGIKNPTDEQIASGNKCWKGSISEYGNEVTYSWDGTTRPKYTSTNGTKGKMNSHNSNNGFGFFWFDGNGWQKSTYTTIPGNITKLTNNAYIYFPETLTTQEDTNKSVGIANDSAERDLLFNFSGSRVLACL